MPFIVPTGSLSCTVMTVLKRHSSKIHSNISALLDPIKLNLICLICFVFLSSREHTSREHTSREHTTTKHCDLPLSRQHLPLSHPPWRKVQRLLQNSMSVLSLRFYKPFGRDL